MGLSEHSARIFEANLKVKVYKYDFGNNFPMKLQVLKVFYWQGGILHKMESTYRFRRYGRTKVHRAPLRGRLGKHADPALSGQHS